MGNPFFNQNQRNAFPNYMPQQNNIQNILGMFNNFKQSFNGDPKQQVQNLLNSGKMSQDQFNYLSQLAIKFQNIIKG